MLLEVGLPLSLAFIMFSLGFGLTFADFARVLTMPRAVVAGVALQVLAIPAVAYLMLMVFDLPPALAFGVMILSFCPGGVTSNILTKLGGGSVALSITLTAVVSLLSVLTVPALVGWAGVTFLGAAAPEIDVLSIGLTMFAITAVPVLIGLFSRRQSGGKAARAEKVISLLAMVLFLLIVVAAIATNWALIVENIGTLGPVLVAINVVLLVLGVAVARGLGLSGGEGICISVEMGVQNATLGITVAGLVAQTAGLPEYALPSALYGITMYLVTIPGLFVLRALFAKA
ncbi:bile acid:sodium symporter family protein [Thalassobius sp. MITS945101]|uniref:bile acid:sodium symporter family protein n=1 Tax=Thalassobius sp. MITS945101 TaxID=3096994 RepID=UPI00399ADAD2